MSSKRLVWADSLKGILILLVVLGHSIQYTTGDACYTNHLWNVIYSFHMPAFMAVSGFLAYRVGGAVSIGRTIWRRFQQLMIPYLAWTFLLMLISGNLNVKRATELLLYPDKGLWFLWTLFFISAIFILCGWLAEKIKVKQEWMVSVVGLLLAACMVAFKTSLLAIQYIAYYFIFYALAYYFHKYYDKLAVVRNLGLVVLIVIWGALAWFWNMQEAPTFLARMPIPATIVNYLYRFVTALIAIYVLLVGMPKVIDSPKAWNKPFVNLGTISLGIYSVNFLVLGNIVPTLQRVGMSENMTILLGFIIGSLCAWGIIWFLSKWKITARLLLGKIS